MVAKVEPIPGYSFAQNDDGAFAIEQDVPCDGVVTVTWKPGEYPSKATTTEMPQVLFLSAVKSYLAEVTQAKSTE